MSLLMDALRRAEEEKKRVAAEGGGADGDPAEELARPDSRAPDPAPDTSSVTPLALEPMGGESADFSIDDGRDIDLNAPPADDASPDADSDETQAGQPVDPSATMPSARAVQSSLDNYFDASRSMASEMPTRRGPAAGNATVGGITGGDTDSQPGVAAHTVFTAGRRPRSRRVAAAVVFALLAGVVVLLAGGLYYGLTSPAPPQLPVSAAPASLPTRPAPAPAPPTGPVTGLAGVRSGEAGPEPAPMNPAGRSTLPIRQQGPVVAPAAAPSGPGAAPVPPSSGTGPLATAAGGTAGRPLFSAAAMPGSEALAETPPPAPAARPPARAASPGDSSAAGPDIGVGAGQLRISRSRQAPRIDADVKQAYAALTAGDDDRAETLYRQALARNPDNINARYGLAGLAMRQSRLDDAYEHYRAIADADPGDGRATAALLALEGTGAEGESRLKRLAAAEPENDFVHFSLGTFYARQQRWPYAQQAFFEALRLDGNNPDYAFNLAVSLDQMGKSRAALDYYQAALRLADGRAARFDPDRVRSRIRAISQARP